MPWFSEGLPFVSSLAIFYHVKRPRRSQSELSLTVESHDFLVLLIDSHFIGNLHHPRILVVKVDTRERFRNPA